MPAPNHFFTEASSGSTPPVGMMRVQGIGSWSDAAARRTRDGWELEIDKRDLQPIRLPDNLPAIRQPQPRVLEVNGMYRHGFMISPAMLDVTLEILNTGQSQLSKRFDLRLELLGQPAPAAQAASALA